MSGRGSKINLMRSLIDSSCSSESDPKSSKPKSNGNDSGFVTKTPDSTPPEIRRVVGRGQIKEMLSSSSDLNLSVGTSAVPQSARGRAVAIAKICADMADIRTQQTTSDLNSTDSSAKISIGGRGNPLRYITKSSNLDEAVDGVAATATNPKTQIGGRGRLIQNLLNARAIANATETTTVASGSRSKLIQNLLNSSSSSDSVKSEKQEVASQMSELNLSVEDPVPLQRTGTKGREIQIMTNYIRMKFDPDQGVYEYEVRFNPSVDAMRFRSQYLKAHSKIIGNTRTFDGVKLYLPIKLPDKETILMSKNQNDDTDIQVKIIYKRKQRMSENIHLYNVLFKRIMKILELVEFGRKFFDPSAPKFIPQHKLEIWPGYVTSVDEFEDGVMLCLDVSHRVLCQTTVLDHIKMLYRGNQADFKSNALKSLLGSVILTRYNNRTYRIDDIMFDSNPLSTFEAGGKKISYVDYYKSQYNIDIMDVKQPLLLNRQERRVAGKDTPQELVFCLIPEICFLTGLTDELRNDFKVMREIAGFTRITPNQRLYSMEQFCKRVNNSPEAKDVLKCWGLTLDQTPITVKARQLDEENVSFNSKVVGVGPAGDFNRAVTNNEVLEAVNISHWLFIHTSNDTRFAKSFLDCVDRNCRPMGISISKPEIVVLTIDKTESYVQALRNKITSNTQIVVIMCPTARDDRYAAIKRICCAEIPVPSQVINAKTLKNETKNRSIVQKIILQMNCKLGGTLWSIRIPFENVMIAGIDTYHDSKNKSNSVSAFVASLNGSYTRWYSRACIQNQKEEFMNGLCSSLQMSLQAYQKMNCQLPSKIIIFRDGVGDGQLNMCNEYEIPQLKSACKLIDPNYAPSFTFIVVQKRIHTRMFKYNGANNLENPLPGTVMDHTVTRRNLFDYFLVPQSVRQGTVSPTHYIVVNDDSNYSPDILQRLSYKLCFLYYNWPGSVRVPACCQYAHKMAYLIGQFVKRNPAEKLNDKLFYL